MVSYYFIIKYSGFTFGFICHQVQVIPWALSDSNSIRSPAPRLDPNRTVFVGGLHGLINAGK